MDRIKRFLLTVSGLLIIVLLSYFSYIGKPFSNWLPFLALCCLFLGMIDRLKSFSASFYGIEAETREVLDKTKNVLEELQLISKEMGKATIEAMKTSGRLGGIPNDIESEVERNLLDSLRDIGISQSGVNEVKKAAEKYDRFDYFENIKRAVNRKYEEKKLPWDEIYSSGGIGAEPSPEQLNDFFESNDVLDEDVQELVEYYKYYCDNLEHKNLDSWIDRKDWLKEES